MLPPLGALRGPTPSAETTLLLSVRFQWLKAHGGVTLDRRHAGTGTHLDLAKMIWIWQNATMSWQRAAVHAP